MRWLGHSANAWITGLVFITLGVEIRAEGPPDPLRLVPAQADLFFKVEQPRKLIESFTSLAVFKQLQGFDAVREYYDSTNYRMFQQLLAHIEKQLELPWPEMLDRLAAGGAVVAVKFGPNPPPILAVVQGIDEALLRKFYNLALALTEQELARREVKDRLERISYRDMETVRIGKEFHAAVISAHAAARSSTASRTVAPGDRRLAGPWHHP